MKLFVNTAETAIRGLPDNHFLSPLCRSTKKSKDLFYPVLTSQPYTNSAYTYYKISNIAPFVITECKHELPLRKKKDIHELSSG